MGYLIVVAVVAVLAICLVFHSAITADIKKMEASIKTSLTSLHGKVGAVQTAVGIPGAPGAQMKTQNAAQAQAKS